MKNMENLIIIGLVLLFVGIILIVVGSFSSTKNVKFGFGGFIGPIPFGFANDPRLLWIVIIVTIVLLIVFVFPFLR
jgi:uncharacterized membrane protein